jgi:hypothetical protein
MTKGLFIFLKFFIQVFEKKNKKNYFYFFEKYHVTSRDIFVISHDVMRYHVVSRDCDGLGKISVKGKKINSFPYSRIIRIKIIIYFDVT